ncbi:hypothetical protein BCR42DRAFT_448069 [Absidia repens]|uniref:Pleckstrin homology domain-containing protein n=1 Tax=Absidia repens TaxID=90262 RepID=A0A1X2IRN8_9FUNG|nr:hypothetical protein BCR42DRAFT_448069 [Absidia repens]
MNQNGRLQGTPKEVPVSQVSDDRDSNPQPMEPSTKGTANNIRHSQMAFANDIAQGLITEVRKLQTTIQDKDRLIKDLEINMADAEKQKELVQRHLRQKTISEEKLKEDNWNLEVTNQDLETTQSELNQTIARLNGEHKKCLQDLRTSLEQMEITKAQQEKATATMDALKARYDHEQQLLRRNNGILHRDMVQLKKQLEVAHTDLKICRSKLAIKATVDSNTITTNMDHQQSRGIKDGGYQNDESYSTLDDDATTKSNLTNNASGLATTSQQRALEIDTLKQSLGHAHRMISSLRNNLQKEKVEKIEFKKLLMDTQESMDQLQKNVANHDAIHTGRGQSKKNTGPNRTKVVRKRGAVARKTLASAKPTLGFPGDDRQELPAIDSALGGDDDVNNNGLQIRLDQDDFLSCDDDTTADDSSSVDETNNVDGDSGEENDCHQLDLSYSGQGQSLDMELKLGGFDAPFKSLSSELGESFTKRECVDKGVNTNSNFGHMSSSTWQQPATTNSPARVKPRNGTSDGCGDVGSGDKSSENTHDIDHSNGASVSEEHSTSTTPVCCSLSSTRTSLNLELSDSLNSPIPASTTVNQPLQRHQRQMDPKPQLMNTDNQNSEISQQEGMVTPLPGSPISSQQILYPTTPLVKETTEYLATNNEFDPQGTIPIVENPAMNTNPSENKSDSSASANNQADNNSQAAAITIEQIPSDSDFDSELVYDAKQQFPKASPRTSIISSNSAAVDPSHDEGLQYSLTPTPAQHDDFTLPLADKLDNALPPVNSAEITTDRQAILVTGGSDKHSNLESAVTGTTEDDDDSHQTSTLLTKTDSLNTAMDNDTETELLGGTIHVKNYQPTLEISNMMSREEAEALIKAGVAEALEKERVDAAARQQQDLSNNFVTMAEAEIMARDRVEAALKKERDRTSAMLTKTQVDTMARAYAEQVILETDGKEMSHELAPTASSFLTKVKTTTSTQDGSSSISRTSAQQRTSHIQMAPSPQPSTSTASTATTSSTSSRRSILSGLMKLQPSISTPAKTMRLRPSASTSSLRKTITSSSSSSSSSKPPHAQRQISNNALHHRYKTTADQHLQPPPASVPSYGTVRITETSMYPRKPSSAHQPEHLRKSSLHSLSSNMSKKGNLAPPSSSSAFLMGGGDQSQHHSSAELISAITQTMIGEWMWKHTRKHMGGGISENKHKRFFWVHPYTRTLYWGNNEPGVDADEARAKSAFIESVSSIPSTDSMGASPLSLLIKTAKRDLKLTAQSLERHELWRTSLSYLLVPPGEDYSVMDDVIQVDAFHDTDTATLATTTGTGSTQTLPIAATNTVLHDSPAENDTHGEATAKDESTSPIVQQGPSDNIDNLDSTTTDSASNKSGEHDVNASTNAGTKDG